MEIGSTEAAFALSRQYGYLTVFVFVFLETSMLFGLLRSEVAVPFTTGVIVTDRSGPSTPPSFPIFRRMTVVKRATRALAKRLTHRVAIESGRR
jgi:hypothetical protein